MRYNRDQMTVDFASTGESVADRATFAVEEISEHMSLTPEGYLLCEEVPIAHLGPLLYNPAEVPNVEVDPTKGNVILVTRDPDVLFAADTMSSFNGKPVTDLHPDDLINSVTDAEHRMGVVLNPRRGSGRRIINGMMADLSNYLVADLLITTANMIKAVLAKKVQVSPGYDADTEQVKPGVGKQVRIVGNHVALVERGRGGPTCAITDGEPETMAKKPNIWQRLNAFLKDNEAELEGLTGTGDEGGDGGGGSGGPQEIVIRVEGPAAAAAAAPTDEAAAGGVGSGAGTGSDDPYEARFKAIEDSITSIAESVAKIAAPAASATGDEAGGGDDDDDKKGKTEDADPDEEKVSNMDAATFAGLLTETMSKAEVISPGVRPPVMDAAASRSRALIGLKRASLTAALADKTKKAVLTTLTKDAAPDFAKMPVATLNVMFDAAALFIGNDNNKKTFNAPPAGSANTGGAMTVAKLQEINAARRAG